MRVVSTPYELSGRVDQKRRTRDALIAAARDLVAAGEAPTVEEAARAASISRTTAYRYFPSQHSLLVAAHPEIEAPTLLADDASDDVVTRLDQVVDAFLTVIFDTEAQQRTMLRLSLESGRGRGAGLPLRQGRAIGWIEDALAPLERSVPNVDRHRLAIAIRSAIGIESLVWLLDVAGLSHADARLLLRDTAHALLQAALAGGRQGGGRGTAG